MMRNEKRAEHKPTSHSLTPEQRNKMIKEGDGEAINRFADTLGKQYKDISTSRIRRFFGGIERMAEFEKNTLQLLRPQLAYAVGKERNNQALKSFREEIDECIQMVDNENDFKNFRNFLEAIIAYHRFYGGKE